MFGGPEPVRKPSVPPSHEPLFRKPVMPRLPLIHKCLNIIAGEQLSHSLANGIFTLDVRTSDGVAAGKAFLQLLQSVDITACHRAIVNLRAPADLQFLTMYLAAPPGADFGKRFGSHESVTARQITINLLNGSANNLFNLITNTTNNKCALLQDLPVFKANVAFRVPPAEIPALKQRVEATVAGLKQALPARYHELLESKAKEINAYIDQHVVALPEEAAVRGLQPVILSLSQRSNVIAKDQVEQLADQRATLEAESDETTYLSVEQDTLVMVDAGNPATAAYTEAAVKLTGVKTAKIFLSHFHSDHTNGLARTLATLDRLGVNVEVVIPEETLFQAMGYFMSNAETLALINNSPRLKLSTLAPDQQAAITARSTMALMAPPASIAHFITSRGYVQVNQDGKARCYSGDINPGAFNPATGKPFTPDEVKAGLRAYFFELAKKAEQAGAKEIDLFIDYGHFPPAIQSYITGELQADLNNYCKAARIDLSLHLDHQKNNDGYILKV